jgi:hypothetical protein
MMEVVQTSEMLVNSYQSAQRYNPEDSRLQKEPYREIGEIKEILKSWRNLGNNL